MKTKQLSKSELWLENHPEFKIYVPGYRFNYNGEEVQVTTRIVARDRMYFRVDNPDYINWSKIKGMIVTNAHKSMNKKSDWDKIWSSSIGNYSSFIETVIYKEFESIITELENELSILYPIVPKSSLQDIWYYELKK